ncbi:MAG: PqqD family protein [Candidatus Baltobacteraceae bacterium]
MIGTDIRAAAVALRPALVATVVEGGAVLLDLETKYFYSLNRSAWAIVQLFEISGASPERIVRQCILWGASGEDEVRSFLAHLSAENLLEPSTEDAAPEVATYAAPWVAPTIERHAEPLQSVVTSAFDPSIPLAE